VQHNKAIITSLEHIKYNNKKLYKIGLSTQLKEIGYILRIFYKSSILIDNIDLVLRLLSMRISKFFLKTTYKYCYMFSRTIGNKEYFL